MVVLNKTNFQLIDRSHLSPKVICVNMYDLHKCRNFITVYFQLSHPGSTFDISYVKLFRTLDTVRFELFTIYYTIFKLFKMLFCYLSLFFNYSLNAQ